jgi:hypothetical protein
MRDPFLRFIIEITGAFIVWAVKGFNGKLSDEMSGPYESNKKRWRNTIISISVFLLILAIMTNFQRTKEKKVNDNKFVITIRK